MKEVLRKIIICYIIGCLAFISFIIIKDFLISKSSLTKRYNIVYMGANGKDDLDDSYFFQNTLDKARDEILAESNIKTRIIVPSGTYYIDKTLYIYSNTYMALDKDAKIIFRGNGNIMIASYAGTDDTNCFQSVVTQEKKSDCKIGGYNQWNNIVIDGGIWDINKNDTFLFRHGSNMQFKNSIVINSNMHAINVSGTKDVLIENVYIKDQVIPKKNRPGNINETIHLDSIDAVGEPDAYPLDGTPVENVVIQNCIFENVLSGIGSHVLYKDDNKIGRDIIIRNNTFKSINYTAINLFSHKNIKVYNNYAYGLDNSYAFLHTYYTGGEIYDNVINNFDTNVVIASNEINENPYTLSIDNNLANSISAMYYIIKYKPNGGKGKMDNSIINYGKLSKTSKNKFTKKGYDFVGWKVHRIYKEGYLCDCNGVECWLTLKERKKENRNFVIYPDEVEVMKTTSRHKGVIEFIAQWKKIDSISVFKEPDKIDYYQSNPTLDLTGGKIKVIYVDKSVEIVDMNKCIVEGFDSNSLGKTKVTINYSGVKTKININILPIEVVDIYIAEKPQKLTYYVGEKPDLTGMKIGVLNSDGSVKMMDKDYIVDLSVLEKPGVQTLSVYYGGKSVSFDIGIKEKQEEITYNSKNLIIKNKEIAKEPHRLPINVLIGIILIGFLLGVSMYNLHLKIRKKAQ